MKSVHRNILVRFILRLLDVLVSFYAKGPVRWREEPFRKATEAEKRFSGVFMAFLPIMFLVGEGCHKSFEAVVDSMIYGRHSIIWLYLGVFIIVGGVGGCLATLGSKIPLSVSVPIAVVMWPILGWFIWTRLI